MLLGVSAEYYGVHRPIEVNITISGCILLAISFCLRWWGMKSLGHQWAIHAVGSSKLSVKDQSILRHGPYQIIRHPIYLAAIMEVIGIPLIANSFYTLGFVLLVNCPLMFLRSRLEEQTLFARYCDEFVDYFKETGRFLPRVSTEKSEQRRREKLFVDFPDRRKGSLTKKPQ